MAQITIKKSSVANKVPLVTDLAYGELALNYQDGKLYYKKANNTIDSFLSATASVSSFNTRTGAITLNSSDVTGALGYTPFSTAGGAVSGNVTVSGEFFTAQPAFGGFPLAPNLIHNSYMNRVTLGVPDGYSVLGSITIEAVSPYTKAFEGPYVSTAVHDANPSGYVTDPELATSTTPYWFGNYFKGPRISRGGMADGWHSFNDGKILKITGTGVTTGHCSIFLPKELNNLGAKWIFNAFVKITKGTHFTVGADAGYNRGNTGYSVTKAVADAGPQGWVRFSTLLNTSQITSIDGLAISMAILPDANGDIEGYVALPYLANVNYKGTNTDSWSGSVVDKLDRMGFYVNPSSAGDVRINNNQVLHAGNYGSYALPLTGGTLSGTISHTGLVATDGTNIDQVKSITKSITLTTDWQDTGIKSTDLATGTYMVQLVANDTGSGGTNNNEYYSGTMSWYSGDTNSAMELPTDEITLHRAGGSGDGALYLRTFRTPTANTDNLKLQIYSNTANASAANYVFKFRRII